jgi:hypothetical protein
MACRDCGEPANDMLFCPPCARFRTARSGPLCKVGDIVLVSMPKDLSTGHDVYPGVVCATLPDRRARIHVLGITGSVIVDSEHGEPKPFLISWKVRS